MTLRHDLRPGAVNILPLKAAGIRVNPDVGLLQFSDLNAFFSQVVFELSDLVHEVLVGFGLPRISTSDLDSFCLNTMVFGDKEPLLLFAPANSEVDMLAVDDAVRAVGDTADFKFRILHRLDSDPAAAILRAARRENLDVDLMAKDLGRNRVLFVAVNPAALRIKLIAPVETVKASRRMDSLELGNPLGTLDLDFRANLVAELLTEPALHAVRPRLDGPGISAEPLGLLGFANSFALRSKNGFLHLFSPIVDRNIISNV